MPYHVAFITDPIASFNPKAETTSFLAHAFGEKKSACYFVEPKNLSLLNHRLFGKGVRAQVKRLPHSKHFAYTVVEECVIDLGKMDCVWLRKDPPVDLNFIDHLSLIEVIQHQTLLINHPSGIKLAPEKIFALTQPELSPPTLISKDKERILQFIKTQKQVVLKPLNLSGGRGIVMAEHKQPGLAALIDVVTHEGQTYICTQKFVPAAKRGDTRVLIWQEQILGAFLRKPAKGDFRGNMHSGATYHKTKITSTQLEKIKKLLPAMQALGLHFVGLDFLGDFLTEVNVTSPMGIGELNHLYSSQIEKTVVKSLLDKF